MAPVELDIALLNGKAGEEREQYIEELLDSHSEAELCQAIIDAVRIDELRATTFGLVFPHSKHRGPHLEAITQCMKAGLPHGLLYQGIEQFGKVLADPEHWELAWQAVGGTPGLLEFCAKISVREVKAVVRAIGACDYGQVQLDARQLAIDELMKALLPSCFPESRYRTSDKRPIQHYYAMLVYACSPGVVLQFLQAKDQHNLLYIRLNFKRLVKVHRDLVQDLVFESVFGKGEIDYRFHERFRHFVYNSPPFTARTKSLSPSMIFARKALEARLVNPEAYQHRWPKSISITEVFFSLYNRCVKKKLPETELHGVLKIGVDMLSSNPQLKSDYTKQNFWFKLITRWRKEPKLYEDLLSAALRLQFDIVKVNMGQHFLTTFQRVKAGEALRWQLLRLYCLNVPDPGVDIDATTDFQPLAEQNWPIDLFYELTKDQAITLLKGLYTANPKYSFLVAKNSSQPSIFQTQSISSQQNFNVILLLTLLQRDFEQAQISAKRAVEELRKKANTARDQPIRAQFAKAASTYAIASGNLELYGEVIAWQERFVRDALTVKTIFGRDAVLTDEGISLLSGIPQSVTDELTPEELTARVDQANAIIMSLQALIPIAKREPSFQRFHWSSVQSLLGNVINRRIASPIFAKFARGPKRHLEDSSKGDYVGIWGGTLSLMDKLDLDSLVSASSSFRSIFDTLSAPELAANTKALLDIGTERRKLQDRQPADEALENISYDMLLILSTGRVPELAQSLILRTIIDRPDASSRHRQFLTVSYMERLSAKDARAMLYAFAAGIGEKLEEQSYIKIGGAPTPPIVKVTTVKYLAQMLRHPTFLSSNEAIEILIDLFKAGTHRDIRLATLESLLSSLDDICKDSDDWRNDPLYEKIMGAFETIIPIAGSINETRPLRPQDWADLKDKIPDITDISTELPPLMNAVLTMGSKYAGLKKLQGEFMTRLFLPILRHSQMEHREWIVLFLTKYNADFTVDNLYPTPISSQMWDVLVDTYPEHIPSALLEDYNAYLLTLLAPPPALSAFNKSLRALATNSTPDVHHWLTVFDNQSKPSLYSITARLLSLLQRGWPITPPPFSLDRVLAMLLDHVSLYLDAYPDWRTTWTASLLSALCPPFIDRNRVTNMSVLAAQQAIWTQRGPLIIESLIALIEAKKADHALNHHRTPLPSTLPLQLYLLPYPLATPSTDTHVDAAIDTAISQFCTALTTLLATHLQGADALRWPAVAASTQAIADLLPTDAVRLPVALHLGTSSPGSGPELAVTLVRLKVAMALLDRFHSDKEATGIVKEVGRERVAVRKMVETWREAEDEGVREMVEEWVRGKGGAWVGAGVIRLGSS